MRGFLHSALRAPVEMTRFGVGRKVLVQSRCALTKAGQHRRLTGQNLTLKPPLQKRSLSASWIWRLVAAEVMTPAVGL